VLSSFLPPSVYAYAGLVTLRPGNENSCQARHQVAAGVVTFHAKTAKADLLLIYLIHQKRLAFSPMLSHPLTLATFCDESNDDEY
jgi:hypothetical protein